MSDNIATLEEFKAVESQIVAALAAGDVEATLRTTSGQLVRATDLLETDTADFIIDVCH